MRGGTLSVRLFVVGLVLGLLVVTVADAAQTAISARGCDDMLARAVKILEENWLSLNERNRTAEVWIMAAAVCTWRNR